VPFPFLSDDWVTEARRIRDTYKGQLPPITTPIKLNLHLTGVPFQDEVLMGHLTTAGGDLELDIGALDKPDATITTDHATARMMFVDGDQNAAMQAFMSGKVRIEGDMTKLILLGQALQPYATSELGQQVAEELKGITEH
jgi:hypothetical protein